ncbi:tRNA nucleotidyltransferase [Dactylonectria macrodidyma]|uniref:tRNA nucleotidyltransferase n=1 Tax=Dactylonectria macrodidyma TaxID=307937 RepID=A0A9P9FSF6_9HYPO|nr:tRNA nucleotidyltransferase [Dactylonectria macrodidyma]
MLDSLLGSVNFNRLQSLSTGISEHSTLEDIASKISGLPEKTDRQKAALEAVVYLSRPECITWESNQACNLAKVVCEGLLSPTTSPGQETAALVTEAGIACLQLLSLTWSYSLDDATLLKVVAFTDCRDPWTTKKAASVASELLRTQLTATRAVEFVVGPVLQTFIKPLFAKPSSRITASGRPARYQTPPQRGQLPPKTSSWKDHAPWVVSTLRWAVDASKPSLIQEHWPLFIPVLLALAEDDSIHVKPRGLETLALFIEKCPPQILHTTGIGLIFEEITFPALLCLPNLTPEAESTKILVPAYDVLIRLAKSHQKPQSLSRRRLLDKLLREGVFAAYFHSPEYAHLVEILMENTATIVECLGIYSTKHLKSLLSMISSVMEDPFAMVYPCAILAASKTLGAIIATCWPRVKEIDNFEQIIHALSLCWLSVCEVSSSPKRDGDVINAISFELIQTSNMLQTLWAQSHSEPLEELGEVLGREPRLAQLFQRFASKPRTSVS